MSDHQDDKDPQFGFPVWILGSPWPSVRTLEDVIEGLVKLEASDGEKCVPIFTDEGVAKSFLEKYGGEAYKDCVPKIVEPKELDLLFKFLAEEQGFTHVLIGRPENRVSMATINEVRFNIAMHLE
jgi:hypothetical protein